MTIPVYVVLSKYHRGGILLPWCSARDCFVVRLLDTDDLALCAYRGEYARAPGLGPNVGVLDVDPSDILAVFEPGDVIEHGRSEVRFVT